MHTTGIVSPASADEAREWLEVAGPIAQTAVREATRAMAFDRDEYDRRVTDEVIETVRNAVFAGLLEVSVGTREEFDAWLDGRDQEPVVLGSEQVDHVAWHAFGDTVVAATFQREEDAAVETLRRQAFGRLYHDLA